MKKLLSVLIALVMVSALCISAAADGENDPVEDTFVSFSLDRFMVGDEYVTSPEMTIEQGTSITATVLGWALFEDGLQEIVYEYDGIRYACEDVYRDRTDVTSFLGYSSELGIHAGFGTDENYMDLSGLENIVLEPGYHNLSVIAVSNGGSEKVLRTLTLNVTGESTQWYWITGEPFDYTNWADGEPSGGDEDKLALWPEEWNDLWNESGEQNGYICEWDYTGAGEHTFNDHSYSVYIGQYSWEQAEKMCEDMGGHLACITSYEEQAFLQSINNNSESLWIGGYIRRSELPVVPSVDEWFCGEESYGNPNWWFNPVGDPDDRYLSFTFNATNPFKGISGYYFCSPDDGEKGPACMKVELISCGAAVAEGYIYCDGDNWYDVDFGAVYGPGEYTIRYSCAYGKGVENEAWFVVGSAGSWSGDGVIVDHNVDVSDFSSKYPCVKLIINKAHIESSSFNTVWVDGEVLCDVNDASDFVRNNPISGSINSVGARGWASVGESEIDSFGYSISGGERVFDYAFTQERTDVQEASGVSASQANGFMISAIDVSYLYDGLYSIELWVRTTSGEELFIDSFDFEITGRPAPSLVNTSFNTVYADGETVCDVDDAVAYIAENPLSGSFASIGLRGWAYVEGCSIGSFGYSIDGGEKHYDAAYIQDRPDVQAAFGVSALEANGFFVNDVDVSGLYNGMHTITVYVIAEEGYEFEVVNAQFEITGREAPYTYLGCSVDSISGVQSSYELQIYGGDVIELLGWAAFEDGLKEIYCTVNGQRYNVEGQYRDRPDVAAVLGYNEEAGNNAGFGLDWEYMRVPGTADLADGRYDFAIVGVSVNGCVAVMREYTLTVGDVVEPEITVREHFYEDNNEFVYTDNGWIGATYPIKNFILYVDGNEIPDAVSFSPLDEGTREREIAGENNAQYLYTVDFKDFGIGDHYYSLYVTLDDGSDTAVLVYDNWMCIEEMHTVNYTIDDFVVDGNRLGRDNTVYYFNSYASAVSVRGWAVINEGYKISGFGYAIDGGEIVSSPDFIQSRPDVQNAFGVPDYRANGYMISNVDVSGLSEGYHKLTIYVMTEDGSSDSALTITFWYGIFDYPEPFITGSGVDYSRKEYGEYLVEGWTGANYPVTGIILKVDGENLDRFLAQTVEDGDEILSDEKAGMFGVRFSAWVDYSRLFQGAHHVEIFAELGDPDRTVLPTGIEEWVYGEREKQTYCNLEALYVNNDARGESANFANRNSISINTGDMLYILGWAVRENTELQQVVYTVNGGSYIECEDNYAPRYDISFGGPRAGIGRDNYAFALTGIDELEAGVYDIEIIAIFEDGEIYVLKAFRLEIDGPVVHTLDEIDDSVLNIVIDGGTEFVNANPGDTVEVKIRLVNNVTISSVNAEVTWSEKLELLFAEYDIYNPKDKSAMINEPDEVDDDFNPIWIGIGNRFRFNWLSARSKVNGDADFVTLTFRVSDDAAPGEFLPVYVSAISPGDICDEELNNIPFKVINGGIDIEENFVVGDLNGDGRISNIDVILLFEYVSGGNNSVRLEAADVDGDGEVNNKDVVMLFGLSSRIDR